MIYTTGTIAISGNTLTGTGTNFTAAGSLIRNGCTVIAMTSPVQVFQITTIGSATSLTVTPAANPTVPAGTRFAILLSDSLSVDGLAQDIAETFTMYQRYMSGFADVMNGTSDVTITINGTAVTVPGQKSLAKKGANSDITSLSGLKTALSIEQGGTGATNAADVRTNLGLGEGSALPVGVPIPWPSATPPTGWLKCNGAAFTASQYPKLALAYPALRLPDLRGEFIRGWDDGRGVDSGRQLFSLQGEDFKAHRHESYFYAGISRNEIPLTSLLSSDKMLTLSSTTNSLSPVDIDANGTLLGNDDYNCVQEGNKNNKRTATGLSTNIIGGSETRPRNVAFNYIVRAA